MFTSAKVRYDIRYLDDDEIEENVRRGWIRRETKPTEPAAAADGEPPRGDAAAAARRGGGGYDGDAAAGDEGGARGGARGGGGGGGGAAVSSPNVTLRTVYATGATCPGGIFARRLVLVPTRAIEAGEASGSCGLLLPCACFVASGSA